MTRRHRNPDQLPMGFMLPETDWSPPESLPDLRGRGLIALDTETRDDGLKHDRGPGWVHGLGWLAGVSVATEDWSGYVPLRHPDTECRDPDQVRRWLQHLFTGEDYIVFQNGPYDMGWLLQGLDLAPPERIHDTKGMGFILDEDRLSYSLEAMCEWQGVEGKDEKTLRDAAEAMGCDPKADLWRMPGRYVGPYAEQDAVATLHLSMKFLPQIEAQGLMDAYTLEMDLIPMVLEMRRRGIRIDISRAEELGRDFAAESQVALDELSSHTSVLGRPVTIDDVNSPRSMMALFESENIPFPRTEKGNPSFKNDWMEKIDHWLPQACVRASRKHELSNKFIKNYVLGFTHRGRIHAEAHQYKSERGGTRTYRFAYGNPPLQQIPSRTADGQRIREAFTPERGEVWGALDYSQQEYRLMVHFASLCGIAGVEDAVATYRDDPSADFHSLVAQLTGLPRKRAKDVNFAKAYGAGVAKFALMTGMTQEEAAATMTQYDTEMPFISGLGEYCKNVADRRGHLRLLDGARVRFERWEPRWVDWRQVREQRFSGPMNPCGLEEARARVRDPEHPWSGRLRRAFTHKAMNSLIQGSAARQTKLAMRQCWREGIVPLLQMHDELDFSFGEEAQALRAVEIMREVRPLEIPMLVDAEFGPSWGWANGERDESYDASWSAAQQFRVAA